jgi:hypothetical protein
MRAEKGQHLLGGKVKSVSTTSRVLPTSPAQLVQRRRPPQRDRSANSMRGLRYLLPGHRRVASLRWRRAAPGDAMP